MSLNVVLVYDVVFDDWGSVDGGTGRLCSARGDVVYAMGRFWFRSNMIRVREGALSSISHQLKGVSGVR